MKGLTMTTVSVQPMKSEPNEREAFSSFWEFYRSNYPLIMSENTYEVMRNEWQHQQKIITNLEEKLQQMVEDNVQLQAKCVLLEKQNTVAVEALESIEDWKFGWDGDCGVTSKASEALAEINRIGE